MQKLKFIGLFDYWLQDSDGEVLTRQLWEEAEFPWDQSVFENTEDLKKLLLNHFRTFEFELHDSLGRVNTKKKLKKVVFADYGSQIFNNS